MKALDVYSEKKRHFSYYFLFILLPYGFDALFPARNRERNKIYSPLFQRCRDFERKSLRRPTGRRTGHGLA